MSDPAQPNSDVLPDVTHQYDAELAQPPSAGDSAPLDAADLKAGAKERAQQRPLLQKIIASFKKERG